MFYVIEVLIALILGAYTGKFLGMVVHYLPQILFDESDEEKEPRDIIKWYFGKPKCPSCQHERTWVESAPILGYLLQKGKCRHCQHPFRRKNFLLEVGTSLLFGGSVLFFPFNYALFFILILNCILICCFFTDYEHSILPDQFTITMIWLGLIASLIPVFVTPREAIIGAVGGYGIFWLFNQIYLYFRGFDGMYPGDFKLNAGIGACLGLKWLLLILIVAGILLVIGTVVRLLLVKSKDNTNFLHQESPYGCYSSIVTMVALYAALLGISI